MSFRTFYINNSFVRYQEFLSGDPVFEKFYLIENPSQIDIIAIPDSYIDLEFTWENNTCRGYACGSFLQGRKSMVSRYQRCFGMKLRPDVRFRFLIHNIQNLVDSRIPLTEFLDVSLLEEHLSECADFAQMLDTAQSFFNNKQFFTLPVIASGAAKMITQTTGIQRITDIASSMGYSQQYVNNIFRQNYGVSLKKYSDIVRMQTALRYLESACVMDVIVDLGYYDQAHFIHDFKQYTSITPTLFVEQVYKNKQCIIV